jgi:hypothetical protein
MTGMRQPGRRGPTRIFKKILICDKKSASLSSRLQNAILEENDVRGWSS